MVGSGQRRWGVLEGYQQWAQRLVKTESRGSAPSPDPAAGWKVGGSVPWLDASREKLRERLAPEPGQRWLDAGCGTGTWAARLAALGCAVGALDRNRLLLWEANRRLTAAGIPCRGLEAPGDHRSPRLPDRPLRIPAYPAPTVPGQQQNSEASLAAEDQARRRRFEGPVGSPGSVTLRWAWLESLPFPSGHFDGAVAAFSLCHVRAFDTVVRQLARVLRSGGHLFILDQHPGWQPPVALQLTGPVLTVPYGGGRDGIHIATYPRPAAEQEACLEAQGFSLEHRWCWQDDGVPWNGHGTEFSNGTGRPRVMLLELTRE